MDTVNRVLLHFESIFVSFHIINLFCEMFCLKDVLCSFKINTTLCFVSNAKIFRHFCVQHIHRDI